MAGEFDEFIPQTTGRKNVFDQPSAQGNFDEFIPTTKPEHFSNVLMRAASAIKPLFMEMADPTNAPGMGVYKGAHGAKSEIMNQIAPNNPIGAEALDIATDPETYIGTGIAKQGAKSGFKKIFPYTSSESRVAFTKDIEKQLGRKYKDLTTKYGEALDNSWASVDLSDIEKGLGFPEIKGIHSMREAQELKNSLTTLIPEAVKAGRKITPKYINASETAQEITRRMLDADKSLEPVMKHYGEMANAFKDVIGKVSGSSAPENIFGGNLLQQVSGFGGKLGDKGKTGLKKFAPDLAKKVHDAKVNENIFRGLRGAAVIAPLQQFIPNPIKRAIWGGATQ